MSPSSVESALATRLRTARQAAGLTQVELAKRVKTDQALLSRIERGEATGRPELLRVIARELKITVSYLLGEDTSEQAVRPTREAITSDRKMPKGLRDLEGRLAHQGNAHHRAQTQDPDLNRSAEDCEQGRVCAADRDPAQHQQQSVSVTKT